MSCTVLQNHSDLPFGHSSFWVFDYRNHKDHSGHSRLPAEEGQEIWEPACALRASCLAMLYVVCREVHALPQQERLHPDSYIWLLVLQGLSQRFLPHCEERVACDGSEHGGRLRALPGQGENMPEHLYLYISG